jgi:hypothetical protein
MSFENRDEDSAVKEPEGPVTSHGEGEAMRPIPDGGLQQSMPEWLRRPPAWRNLPRREEPPRTELAETSNSTEVVLTAPVTEAPRELPEPDTSEIDPRSLVDISDLPQWLQDLAARSDALSAPPVMTETPVARTAEENVMKEPQKRLESEPREERVVPFEPVDKKKWAVPEQETKVYGGGKPATGMSQMMMIGIGLAVLIIIAIILIAVM